MLNHQQTLLQKLVIDIEYLAMSPSPIGARSARMERALCTFMRWTFSDPSLGLLPFGTGVDAALALNHVVMVLDERRIWQGYVNLSMPTGYFDYNLVNSIVRRFKDGGIDVFHETGWPTSGRFQIHFNIKAQVDKQFTRAAMRTFLLIAKALEIPVERFTKYYPRVTQETLIRRREGDAPGNWIPFGSYLAYKFYPSS